MNRLLWFGHRKNNYEEDEAVTERLSLVPKSPCTTKENRQTSLFRKALAGKERQQKLLRQTTEHLLDELKYILAISQEMTESGKRRYGKQVGNEYDENRELDARFTSFDYMPRPVSVAKECCWELGLPSVNHSFDCDQNHVLYTGPKVPTHVQCKRHDLLVRSNGGTGLIPEREKSTKSGRRLTSLLRFFRPCTVGKQTGCSNQQHDCCIQSMRKSQVSPVSKSARNVNTPTHQEKHIRDKEDTTQVCGFERQTTVSKSEAGIDDTAQLDVNLQEARVAHKKGVWYRFKGFFAGCIRPKVKD